MYVTAHTYITLRAMLTFYDYNSEVAGEQETHFERLHFLNERFQPDTRQFIGISQRTET